MSTETAPHPEASLGLPPIAGKVIDPAPKQIVSTLRKIEGRSRVGGLGYRALNRFIYSKATLLAAGTTYYVFLALFALATLGYGIAAWLGADRLSETITEGLTAAFPGLVGENGIDSDAMRAVGQTSSIIGLVLMLYSGSGAMYATSRSLHTIFGAPKDPRNYLWARARLGGWLLLLAPLALASYVMSGTVAGLANQVLANLGIDSAGADAIVVSVGLAVALGLDFLIIFLIFSHLGGIRPPLRARLLGSAIGAVAIEALKYVMAFVISYSISKPQYGAFALPITLLLVLYLQCITIFLCGALIAGFSESPGTYGSAPPEPEAPPNPDTQPIPAPKPQVSSDATGTRQDNAADPAAGQTRLAE